MSLQLLFPYHEHDLSIRADSKGLLRPIDRIRIEHYITAPYLVGVAKRQISVTFVHVEREVIQREKATLHVISNEKVTVFPGNTYSVFEKEGHRILFSDTSSHSYSVTYSERALPESIAVRGDFVNALTPAPEALLLRIYRDILHHTLLQQGFLLFHGAAVTKNGRTVLIVGDKGSGKTPWMLKALRSGWSFVANDRVLIELHQQPRIATFPIAAMLNRLSLTQLPVLLRNAILANRSSRKDHLSGMHAKIGVTPTELANAFGVPYVMTGRLDRVLILNGTQEKHREMALRSPNCEMAQTEIEKNVFYPSDPTYLFDMFCKSLPSKGESKRLLARHIANKASLLCFCWDKFADYTFPNLA